MRSLTTVTLLLLLASASTAQTRLLRFPDLHADRVVFCYASDLWVAPAVGGHATRLTSHPGHELFPRFSPDGKWVAFTGQYDGDEQVYVMPVDGGVPRQLTWYPARGPLPPRWGYDHQVYGWTSDSKRVLFRSLRAGFDLTDSRLYTVSIDGGLPTPLEMPVSGAGDLSPDDTKVAYCPLFRDFRSWKRYQGGWSQDVWIFDRESGVGERITEHDRADRDPMWIGERIWFASDRTGTMNLFSFDITSRRTQQHTFSDTWDLRWPSKADDGRVVYESAGELHIYATASGHSRKISIRVPDDGVHRRAERVSAGAAIEDFELSPKGQRALFCARGDVFTVPIEKGPTRNLTRTSDAHEKHARWSPDGRKICYVSDASGEEEIYLIDQDGSSKPERLTDDGHTMRYAPEWSPDGERLAYSDSTGTLQVMSLADKAQVVVARDVDASLRTIAWSPCSGHVAYTLTSANDFESIHVWSVESGKSERLTGELWSETSPAWGPNGNYLYYLSNRSYSPQICGHEWNFALDREIGIFAMALRSDVPHPFPPESDEVEFSDEDESEDETGEKEDSEPKYTVLEFAGIAQRVAPVPVPADNYGGLTSAGDNLVYFKSPAFFYGRGPASKTELMLFTRKDRKAQSLGTDVSGYALSADGTKLLVRQGGAYHRFDAAPDGGSKKKTVNTDGMTSMRDPAVEWPHIFDQVWRRFRDFFYVENMHGYDWEALGDQYRPLLEHVAHRSDLNYVLTEMVAELNCSHSYITGGDWDEPERHPVALPGARFELDPSEGRYRIAEILPGQNEEAKYRSPLTEIGVDVKVGDYVLAINGQPLAGDDNPYRLLRDQHRAPVTLTLNSAATTKGAREVSYRPITAESSLRYLRWVNRNRKWVDHETGGRVGYLHVPDMGANGLAEFIKWYYGQVRKEGLVIDVRGNGGGNVSEMLINRLNKTLLSTGFRRNSDVPSAYPDVVFHGHLVCLLSETSASDGDIFPAMFKRAGLGPLIGKRSWGGVIGITSRGPLLDGGGINVPEFGFNDTEGNWVIEGHGVDPDIEVENDPRSVLDGRDPQLERGVQEVLKAMQANPRSLPKRKPDPDRSKRNR